MVMAVCVCASKESRIHCVSGFAHLFDRKAAQRERQAISIVGLVERKIENSGREKAKEEYPKLIS